MIGLTFQGIYDSDVEYVVKHEGILAFLQTMEWERKRHLSVNMRYVDEKSVSIESRRFCRTDYIKVEIFVKAGKQPFYVE